MTTEENIQYLTKLNSRNTRFSGYVFSKLSPILCTKSFQSDLAKIKNKYPSVPNLETDKDAHADLMKKIYEVAVKYNLEKDRVGFFFLNWDDVLKDYLYNNDLSRSEAPFKIARLKDIEFKDASFVLAINSLATKDEILDGIKDSWFWIQRKQEQQLTEEGGVDYDWSKLESINKKSSKFKYHPRPFFERDVAIYQLHKEGLSSTQIAGDVKYNLDPAHIRRITGDMKQIFEPDE